MSIEGIDTIFEIDLSGQEHAVSERLPCWLARQAVAALVEEAQLTPKPGLVDRRGSGAHDDLSLELMLRSAGALEPYFEMMARLAKDRPLDIALREDLAAEGRRAELAMLAATGGVNTHRGAIWALGLLVAAAAHHRTGDEELVAASAGVLAELPDRQFRGTESHGEKARRAFGVLGARGEAAAGFPHVLRAGLPALRIARAQGRAENVARLNALLSIMSTLPDTCLLHRGGLAALEAAQQGARAVLARGGCGTADGRHALEALDARLLQLWASPGGSADLLAATLFLDRIGGLRGSGQGRFA